ncbi:hypothetical protein N8T08_010009 [Aspergillus melleus]|uniref:Uncharacterized protein n=1 Tax=Aspergillus melleus TaxID=138277 RepID=A0ACC3ATN7_9EURO|nr:hypothetical protein N8T08_010009 [Aspergillus melleus]
MTAQRPLSPDELSCVSEFSFPDDLEYNQALITSTFGLLRLGAMESEDRRAPTPYVALAQTSLAAYLNSGMVGFDNIREACHWRFIELGLLMLKECYTTYCEYWLAVLPEYKGPALALDGNYNEKVEIPEELSDLVQKPMLRYTVQYLINVPHSASRSQGSSQTSLPRVGAPSS